MKRLALALLAALALWSTPSPAQQPITLGPNSVYGRLGVSSGPGQSIPFATLSAALFSGNIPITSLNNIAANTVLSNWTGSSAAVLANTWPSCPDTGGNHLNYVNGTGLTCGTSGTSGGTLTNTTFNTAGVGNSFLIAGTPITAVTGSGPVVLQTTPTLVTPILGVASATSINRTAFVAPATSSTFGVADGKTATFSNTLTLTGIDGSSVNLGAGGTALYGSRQITTVGPLAGGGDLSADRTLTTLMNTGKLQGRGSAGAGVMEEISIGSGLSLSGTTLSASGGGGGGTPSPPQGRLTLTTGTAITTTDVTGATTLFYTPAVGGYLPITTDGVNFTMTPFTELSQLTTDSTKSPAAVTASSVYDIFAWSDLGTIRATRGPPWTTGDGPSATRGTGAGTTELQLVSGVWTNKNAISNGPAANKGTLLGSVRSNGSSQLTDSLLFRWVSNVYNAVPRAMRAADSTDQWNYTTAAFRQANANAANQIDFLQSLPGGLLSANVAHNSSNTNTGVLQTAGIGIGRCTTNDANMWAVHNSAAVNSVMPMTAFYTGYPGLGRTFACWEEYSAATGLTTWYGDVGVPGVVQTGISGWINN